MWTLYDQGKISTPEATFWLNEDPTQSSITIGGRPANATSTEYIEQGLLKMYDHWWTVKMTGF